MKKIRIILLIASLVLVTGCNSAKEVTHNTSEETVITNPVEEKVLTKGSTVEYDFSTSLYNIKVNMQYNNKYFTLDSKNLSATYYSITAYTEEYKIPYFDSIKEAMTDENKNLKVGDYEALRMVTDIKVMTLVKIDEKTIIYIVADSEGKCLADEIYNDTEYKNILKNIKISVKKK